MKREAKLVNLIRVEKIQSNISARKVVIAFIALMFTLLLINPFTLASLRFENSEKLIDQRNIETVKKTDKQKALTTFYNRAFGFEQNLGQYPETIQFASKSKQYSSWLTETGITISDSERLKKPIVIEFAGAQKQHMHGQQPLPGITNYFRGNDQSKWVRNVNRYREVATENVYPHIDVRYYGKNHLLEYDFIVRPGGATDDIVLDIHHIDSIELNEQGDLVIVSGNERLLQRKPVIYQIINDQKIPVEGEYRLQSKSKVSIEVAQYDKNLPLVIDPLLEFSTYHGGNGDDIISDLVVDSSGNIYVTGATASTNFPVANAAQSTYGGGNVDAFVSKISSDGTSIVYSTYYGGSDAENDAIGDPELEFLAAGITINDQGEVYAVGGTVSDTDFPLVNAYQTTYGGGWADGYILKLNSAGNTVLFASYLGGDDGDLLTDVELDSQGNMVVVGFSSSVDFPTTTGVLQENKTGPFYHEGVIAKFNTTGGIVFSTFLGGNKDDELFNIELDSSDNIYISGSTESNSSLPLLNAAQATHSGNYDMYIAKLNSTATSLLFGTYWGGSSRDEGRGLTLDSNGKIIITGDTNSTNFPTQSAYQSTKSGHRDAVLVKMSDTGVVDFSTYFGSNNNEYSWDIEVDDQDAIYISGTTHSPNFTEVSPLTDFTLTWTNNGSSGAEAFISQFSNDGSTLDFSSKFGGDDADHAYALEVTGQGDIYLGGHTRSYDFFTTTGVIQTTKNPYGDSFLVKLDDGNADPVINSTAILTGEVGVLYSYDVEATDADQDTLTYALTTSPAGMTINSTSGLIQWTPTAAGDEDVVVEVTDGNGGSDTQSFTINVPVPNQSPTITTTAITTANVAELYSYDVDATDPELDTLTFSLNVSPTGMTINSSSGLIQWTPAAEGDNNVTVRVDDGNGGFDTQSFVISVGPANQAPTITSIAITAATATVPYSYDVEATDPDLDTLTYSLTTFPTGMTINSSSGLIQWTPDQLGDHPVTVEVDDGRPGGIATQSYTLTVSNVNQMPQITSTAITTATVDIQYSYDVEATDPDQDPLVYSLTQAPLGMTIDENTGLIAWTPADAGSADVTVMVDDGNLNVGQVFTITVAYNPNNQPPGLVAIGNQTANLGQTLMLQLGATDPEGEPIVFGAEPLPLLTNATLNAETGAFTFTPEVSQVGDHVIKFMATDGRFMDEEEITITVPAAGAVTTFSGRVLTLNDAPLEGVRIEIEGAEDTTDVNGMVFVDNIPLTVTGKTRVLIDGAAIQNSPAGTYATVPEQFHLIQGANNVLPFDMTLLPLDTAAADHVSPFVESIVDSSPAAETGVPVTMTVPPQNAILDSTGEMFDGDVTISRIEDPSDGPAPLPADIDLSYYIAIQPFGVRYDPPIPISFPNVENFAPGVILDFFALNHDTGAFEKIGEGTVSADGLTVDSNGGVVRENSWHGTVPRSASGEEGADNNDKGDECDEETASSCGKKSGNLSEEHITAPYRSLETSRSLRLEYNSTQANPRPIIPIDVVIGTAQPLPVNMSHTVKVGGVDTGEEFFFEPPSNLLATTSPAIQFGGALFATGRYDYDYSFNCNFPISRRTTPVQGQVIVQNDTNSEFGAGWTLDGLHKLHKNEDSSVLLTTGDGDAWLFESDGAAGYISPNGDFSVLVENAGSTFTRTDKDGMVYQFNTDGLITQAIDRNGNTMSYFYNANNQIERITDPVGLDTVFTYSAGKASVITDPANRQTKLEYDSEGNLIKITDPDNTSRTFVYESGTHLMTSQTSKRGFTSSYEYDFAGRIRKATRKDGTVVEMVTADTRGLIDNTQGSGIETNLASEPPLKDEISTASVDGRGNLSSMKLNQLGQAIEKTDEIGRTYAYQRDNDGNATQSTRANGSNIARTFDGNGNALTITEDFNSALATFTYDSFSLVTSIINPRNHTLTITRDPANGNALSSVNHLGHTLTMTYNSQGLIETSTTPNQLVTTYAYNLEGLLESRTETPPAGSPGNVRVTTYTYFDTGLLQTINTPDNIILTYAYDELSRLTSITDNLDQKIETTYDEFGNIIQTDTRDPDDTLVRTVVNEYDQRERFIKQRMPHIGVTESVYENVLDPESNLIELIDARGNRTKNQYDPSHRMDQSTSRIDGITQYEYDTEDRIVKVTAPNGVITEYEYDLLSRKTREISSDRGTITYTYDLANNMTSITDARGITATYTYDELERISSITYPNSHPGKNENVTYTYDNCSLGVGRLCQLQDESGTMSFEYDAFGNIVKETKVELGVTYVTDYTYTDGDRLSSITLPSGRQVTYTRDGVQRLQTIDAQINSLSQNIVSNIQYRADNLMIQYTHGNGTVDDRTYDLQGRLLTQTLTSGATTLDSRTYVYDENSNITSRTTTPQTSNYTYDARDRITDELIDGATDIGFTYDLNDNRLIDNRTSNNNQTSYSFFVNSNRLLLLDELQTGATVLTAEPEQNYVYNDANRIWQYVENGTLKAEYIYNAFGQRTRKIRYQSDGITVDSTTIYHYDQNGRLITETTETGTLIKDYLWGDSYYVCAQIDNNAGTDNLLFLHADHLMTPRFATSSTGTLVWRWESEAFGKTNAEEDPDGDLTLTVVNLRFPGQYFDGESSNYYNHHRYYLSELGRYNKSDPIGLLGGLNTYNYTGANALSFIDPYGLTEYRDAVDQAGYYDSYKGYGDSRDAKDAAENSGLPGSHNGPQDAYRHCVWSCMMTKSTGTSTAKTFGDIHEKWNRKQGQPADEEAMDQANNEAGRQCGAKPEDCKVTCMDAYKNCSLFGLGGKKMCP